MTFWRSIPWYIYAFALAVGLFCLSCVGVVRYGAAEYQRGRKSVQDGVRFDTVMLGVARKADRAAKAHTDTVVQRLTVTRWRTDTLVQNLPDSIRVVPEVRELIKNVYTLTAQVDTLTRTLDVERATSVLRASVDSAALVSAQVVITAKEDEIVTLKKRPQWRTVALALGAGVVAGVLK